MMLLNGVLWLLALGVAIPMVVVVVECVAALWPPFPSDAALASGVDSRLAREGAEERGSERVAVLLPAHNEAQGITTTLHSIRPQLGPRDRLVVVADNCDDDTAVVARAAGATVIERVVPHQRGKGYALDYGIQFLSEDPPDVVIMVDADCTIYPGSVSRLASLALARRRPIQALNLIAAPADASPLMRISTFAFLIKNGVRPRGLKRLGLPCLLTGTGMAFLWSALRAVSLRDGLTAEDMRLTVDLALAGYPPLLCEAGRVTSPAARGAAAYDQRVRWEHGHLYTLITQGPRLLKGAWLQQRLDLFALWLEVSVPPLSLLLLLYVGVLVGGSLAGLLGWTWGPVRLLIGGGGMLLLSLVAVWARFARNELPPRALLLGVPYILAKLPLYLAFLRRRQIASTRTDRG